MKQAIWKQCSISKTNSPQRPGNPSIKY